MAKVNHEEIIALSEDPNVSVDEVRGRPPTPEERRRITELADTLFRQASLETQVEVIRAIPTHISAQRIGLLPHNEPPEILSHLPADLASNISALLPAGVS